MRLVKISAPQGRGKDIAAVAFACGLHEVSLQQSTALRADGSSPARDVLDLRAATPDAKDIDRLLAAPFYTSDDFVIEVKEPRAFLQATSLRMLTKPVPAVLDSIRSSGNSHTSRTALLGGFSSRPSCVLSEW